MKKILIIFVLGVLFGMPVYRADAAIQVNIKDSRQPTSFDIQTVSITKSPNTNLFRFDFKTADVTNVSRIDHWKIKIWCDEGVKMGFNDNGVNRCGTAMYFSKDQALSQFALFLTKSSEKRAKFSFQIKAGDKDRNWLHTEKEAFIW